MRSDNRAHDQVRPFSIDLDIQPQAYASLLISCGRTRVICAVSLEQRVPSFLEGQGKGWITAEYALLPGATAPRAGREVGSRSGRSMEIQRLIGRSLRMMVDLRRLDGYNLRVDCDVLNADGGTRTAAITGAALAVKRALARMTATGLLASLPGILPTAAISAGIVAGEVLLDLDYGEDHRADGDGNFVMAGGRWVEIQVSAERAPFDEAQFATMKRLAEKGIAELTGLWDMF